MRDAQDPTPILIIGGGLTGLSTAIHLGEKGAAYQLFEKEERVGGHARTDVVQGFHFDKTGHWLHLRDPAMKALVQKVLPGTSPESELVPVARKARVFSHGVLTRYPFQANLFGLPPSVVSECLLSFIQAQSDPKSQAPPTDFADFCEKRFGSGISRHFMIPYNHKLWGVHPREITAAWCTRFVPIPSITDVVRGAVGDTPDEMGYNIHFLYPRKGGIETLTRALRDQIPQDRIHVGAALESIDLRAQKATIAGEEVAYRAVVATLPLPELARRVVDLPDEMAELAAKLRCTSVRYLNVATRTRTKADYHWIYVPEERYPFYRVGIYTNAVPDMAPSGHGSLYVELSERGPLGDKNQVMHEVTEALCQAGTLQSAEDILFMELRELPYAYVVFDDAYYETVNRLLSFFESWKVYPRGRYGSWTYNSMEDCLLLGKSVAEQVQGRGT